MKYQVFFALILLSATVFAQRLRTLEEMEAVFGSESKKLEKIENALNSTETDDSIRDASDNLEIALDQLLNIEEKLKSLGEGINLNSIENKANIEAFKNNINQIKDLKDKVDFEAIKEAKEFEKVDELSEKVIKGEIAIANNDEIEKEIIKSAQQKDPALRELRNLGLSEEITANVEKGQEIQGYMSTCMGAFFKNVPPSFCWKKGADFGKIPTGCPAGYFRSLALCFKHCDSGYTHVLGICWQQCVGKKDIGLICWKNFFNWHWKRTYIPHSMTNFDSRIPCPDGMYRSGALCYRDCAKALLVNCGIGACAQSGAACAQGIITMILEFIAGLAQFVLFVVSFGSSSGATPAVSTAKEGLKQGIVKAGQAALKAAFNSFKSWITSFTKEKIIAWLKKKVIEVIVDKTKTFLIEKACGAVGDYIFEQAQEKAEPTLTMSEKIMSLTEKIPIYGVCSKIDTNNGSPNDEIACAKNVLETIGMVDPTGICAMAAAFMQPVCDV